MKPVSGHPGGDLPQHLQHRERDQPQQDPAAVNARRTTGLAAGSRARLLRSIGYIPQHPVFAPHQTVYEDVRFALRVIGKTDAVVRRVVPEILELVGLFGEEHRYMTELSDVHRTEYEGTALRENLGLDLPAPE